MEEEQRIANRLNYRKLLKRKKRFILTATIFFLCYYLMLPLAITFFPGLMGRPVYHAFTIAWLGAFAQFLMIWLLGVVYFYEAKGYDKLVDEIKRRGKRL